MISQRLCRRNIPCAEGEEVRFAPDSPLEEDGFELIVPVSKSEPVLESS